MTNKPTASAASLLEIQSDDVVDVAAFMHRHMNRQFSSSVWAKVLRAQWLDDAPNFGFMLKEYNGAIVGVLCAIYSPQIINGERERICNIHSWVVLPEYRTKSVLLVLAAIRQAGYHFTMFSPNESGLEIFSYLKFKPLGKTVTSLFHIPSLPGSGVHFSEDDEEGGRGLAEDQLKIYRDHLAFPWLNCLVFSKAGKTGFILYRRCTYKRLASARILYISDKALFICSWKAIRTHLLFSKGLFSSRIESRFIQEKLTFSRQPEPDQHKFYYSSSLCPDDIECIYSELVVLDLYGQE